MRYREDSEGRPERSVCGFFVGCMLACGRSAPRRLPLAFGNAPFARRGSVLPMLEKGPPAEEGVATFQTLEQRAASENFAQLPVRIGCSVLGT